MTTSTMTYAELIRYLFAQSQLQVNEYAERITSSVTQLSNVLNGSQPGSLKMLQACLRVAGLSLADCLCVPGQQTKEEQDLITQLLSIVRSHDDRARQGIAVNIEYIADKVLEASKRAAAKRRKEGRDPPGKHPRALSR